MGRGEELRKYLPSILTPKIIYYIGHLWPYIVGENEVVSTSSLLL